MSWLVQALCIYPAAETFRLYFSNARIQILLLIFPETLTLHLNSQVSYCVSLQVSLYNMIPGGSWLERLNSASRMFPKGRHLAIIEPFYKVMGDGLHGVRVDNPAEVSEIIIQHECRKQLSQGFRPQNHILFNFGAVPELLKPMTKGLDKCKQAWMYVKKTVEL